MHRHPALQRIQRAVYGQVAEIIFTDWTSRARAFGIALALALLPGALDAPAAGALGVVAVPPAGPLLPVAAPAPDVALLGLLVVAAPALALRPVTWTRCPTWFARSPPRNDQVIERPALAPAAADAVALEASGRAPGVAAVAPVVPVAVPAAPLALLPPVAVAGAELAPADAMVESF